MAIKKQRQEQRRTHEERCHTDLYLGSGLSDFSWKVSITSLEEAQGGLMLELPHHA
jgi:hypothetical protein